MNILIVGLGYVGLPLALGLTRHFDNVVGFEISDYRRKLLLSNKSPVDTVSDHELTRSQLIITGELSDKPKVDIVFVCVPTPLDTNNEPDTSLIDNAIDKVSKFISDDAIVVNVSTVAPGYTDSVCNKYNIVNYGFAPEREDPGNNSFNLSNTNRIFAGNNIYSSEKMRKIFERMGIKSHLASSIKVAETTKLLENTHRLVNIAFMNEFKRLCDKLDISVQEVNDLASTKPYGYTKFLPGVGIGGHCIPIDPIYLRSTANCIEFNTKFIDIALISEAEHKKYIYQKIKTYIEVNKFRNVLLCGVTYKPNISDVRCSPALKIAEMLIASCSDTIAVYDPHVSVTDPLIKGLGDAYVGDETPRLDCYDAAVILTPHTLFDQQLSSLKKANKVYNPIENWRN